MCKTRFILCLIFSVLIRAELDFSTAVQNPDDKHNPQNQALHLRLVQASYGQEIAGYAASAGQEFLVVETGWENIHPKQKVSKDKLEGKTDRTMGVSGLGGKPKKQPEYVEVDVAYQIPKLFDHVYLLADGLAIALHEATETVTGGYNLQQKFTISKQGERRKATLVYLAPEGTHNLALQLFDYQYGHILLPIKGNAGLAKGTGEPPPRSLDNAQADKVAFASLGLKTQPQYQAKAAPSGWTYAVVKLSGKSLAGGSVKDIVQIKPRGYTWLITDGGFLYDYAESTTAVGGLLRFTPEIYQLQELAFLVPEIEKNFKMGVRVQNQVLELELGTMSPQGMPAAKAQHRDGDIMEILIFGTREQNSRIILDLGIRSLYDRGGIDIKMNQQFFLCIEEKEFPVDAAATGTLLRHPPLPFTVPPGVSLRFELAFDAQGIATALRFRGYESEAILKFTLQ